MVILGERIGMRTTIFLLLMQTFCSAVYAQKVDGTYKGKLPCADCRAIETMLILKSDTIGQGTYVLTNKREGGQTWDSVQSDKGRWYKLHFTYEHKEMKQPAGITMVIGMAVKGQPGRSTLYGLKKDGNLIPLEIEEGNMKEAKGPFDLTLVRQ